MDKAQVSAAIENVFTQKGWKSKPQEGKAPQETQVSKPKDSAPRSMLASYAKDIFCAVLASGTQSDDLLQDMDSAVALVKRAMAGFE